MKVDRPEPMEERFLDLIRRNHPRITRICASWTRSPEEQEDLRSEVFLQLWRSLPSFDGRADEDTWLYRVTLNTALLHARRKRRRPRLAAANGEGSEPSASPEAAARLEARERRRLLDDALRRLGDVDRTLITLWLEELPYRRIAEITGMTNNHVGVALHRARKRLAELVAAEEAADGSR